MRSRKTRKPKRVPEIKSILAVGRRVRGPARVRVFRGSQSSPNTRSGPSSSSLVSSRKQIERQMKQMMTPASAT